MNPQAVNPTQENDAIEYLPTLAEISALPRATCKDIPHRCRLQWARVLTTTLKEALGSTGVGGWAKLAMLPKCTLAAPRRGGRKGHMSYASHVSNCLERWEKGDVSGLWKKLIVEQEKRSPRKEPDEHSLEEEMRKANLRAELLVRQGEFSRGLAALTADPLAPDNDDTLSQLLLKHPTRHTTEPPVDMPPLGPGVLTLGETDVRNALKGFHRGSSSGTMGLRAEHLQAALLVNEDLDVTPLSALTALTNHLLEGKAPLDVQEAFAGARLCALRKGESGVRPIAAGGETLRRLTSKAACLAVRTKARELFAGTQFGVATPAGAERLIHLCRKTMHENSENSDFVLCKVDLKNAFNNVSRAAFIALTRHYFPELSRWVEWCYGTTSALTYGQIRISSEEGAQQGDPLGPLLFSLVMLQVSEEIKISSGGLQLHMWYLDDGVLAGPSYEVQNALRVIAEVGPKWGMFLNPEKCEIITHPASAMQTRHFLSNPSRTKEFPRQFFYSWEPHRFFRILSYLPRGTCNRPRCRHSPGNTKPRRPASCPFATSSMCRILPNDVCTAYNTFS